MRKRPVQLRGEYEIRIGRNLPYPELRQFGFDVPVKRSIDLDHVEEVGEVLEGVDLLSGDFRRVEDALPVLVGPSGHTDANSGCVDHCGWRSGGKGLGWRVALSVFSRQSSVASFQLPAKTLTAGIAENSRGGRRDNPPGENRPPAGPSPHA